MTYESTRLTQYVETPKAFVELLIEQRERLDDEVHELRGILQNIANVLDRAHSQNRSALSPSEVADIRAYISSAHYRPEQSRRISR